jgi:hypothetical protein
VARRFAALPEARPIGHTETALSSPAPQARGPTGPETRPPTAMLQNQSPYCLLPSVLQAQDLDFLAQGCMHVLDASRIPCFSLIDAQDSPTFLKIKQAMEQAVGAELFYLNDFYIYTDATFKTAWHMDTELFSFHRAVNAWILLSPDSVTDPLGFIDGLNTSPENSYHSVAAQDGGFVFSDYHTRRRLNWSADEVASRHLHTPTIHKGDVLAIDPGHFHMTNVSTPKHAVAIKFVIKGEHGFLSQKQVHPVLWPEVKTFNKLVKGKDDWRDVVGGIKEALLTEEGRKVLSSGFYPAQFETYRQRLRSIVTGSGLA